MSGNPITTLPIGIAKFTNLRVLYLGDLQLEKKKFMEFLKACVKPVFLTTRSKYENTDNSYLCICIDNIEPEWEELENVFYRTPPN